MNITSVLNIENIVFELKVTTKAEINDESLESLKTNKRVKDLKTVTADKLNDK